MDNYTIDSDAYASQLHRDRAELSALPDEEVALLMTIIRELRRAEAKHAPMCSAHHGYAVILEELDEVFDAIKDNDMIHAQTEMVQVAAVALRFLKDLA